MRHGLQVIFSTVCPDRRSELLQTVRLEAIWIFVAKQEHRVRAGIRSCELIWPGSGGAQGMLVIKDGRIGKRGCRLIFAQPECNFGRDRKSTRLNSSH